MNFHSDRTANIRLVTSLARLFVGPDRAVPLGLIVNEFITNSVKYAFDGQPGVITVELHLEATQQAQLTLGDNGKGLRGLSETEAGGTGMKLIGVLTQQIGAEAAWRDDNGAELTLTFPHDGGGP